MQIVRGGRLSQFCFQPQKFSSEFYLFYDNVLLGLKWRTAGQAQTWLVKIFQTV